MAVITAVPDPVACTADLGPVWAIPPWDTAACTIIALLPLPPCITAAILITAPTAADAAAAPFPHLF